MKFLIEIILPYVKTDRERSGLERQPALLIYDVFRGQTTGKFLDVLKDNNILSTKIPPNMTRASTAGFNRKHIRERLHEGNV